MASVDARSHLQSDLSVLHARESQGDLEEQPGVVVSIVCGLSGGH